VNLNCVGRGEWFVTAPVLALCLAVVVAPLSAQQDDVGIAVGARPPAITLEDLDGKPVDLGTIIGKKPVLLEFWATWCTLCAALLPKLEAARSRFGDRVEFVAIAVAVGQTPAAVKRHLARHPAPLRFLWDRGGNAVRAFQAPATSFVVVLDRDGRVAYTGIGEEQDIEGAVRRVVN
jgi:thiol-disulfide isomerase/thioredoxin